MLPATLDWKLKVYFETHLHRRILEQKETNVNRKGKIEKKEKYSTENKSKDLRMRMK